MLSACLDLGKTLLPPHFTISIFWNGLVFRLISHFQGGFLTDLLPSDWQGNTGSQPFLLSPSRRLGRAVTSSATGCFCRRHAPQLPPVFLCLPGADGCQPVSQVHLGGASVWCIFTGNQCVSPPRARWIRAPCPLGSESPRWSVQTPHKGLVS